MLRTEQGYVKDGAGLWKGRSRVMCRTEQGYVKDGAGLCKGRSRVMCRTEPVKEGPNLF